MKVNLKNKRIFICATEQSGDNIGAGIIEQLLKYNTNITVDGVGGSKMSPYLSNQYFSTNDFKSIGILEIFFSIIKYINMISFLSKKIIKNNYDLVITIDSPDFNYPLIKKVRKNRFNHNIIQIVAPTVWAWREDRARKFSKIFDEILVLFEFEKKYFMKYGLKTTFIGHPIYYLKDLPSSKIKKDVIAFLPGSRLGEVKSLFKYFQISYEYLLKVKPNITIFIPTLPHLKNIISSNTANWQIKTIISTDENLNNQYYSFANYALVCSGTASLEISKRLIPQLVIYKLNYITEIIMRNFVKIPFANIINIIEREMVIPELTNSKLNKMIFVQKFDDLINNNLANDKQIYNVKHALKKIESSDSPYFIATKRIINYL